MAGYQQQMALMAMANFKELAADAPRRRVLRHGLRDMIRAMPLGQPARFGKAFYDKAAEVCAL